MSDEDVLKYARIFSKAKGDTYKIHFGDKIVDETEVWKGVLDLIYKLQKENGELEILIKKILNNIGVEVELAWRKLEKLEEEND